MKKTLEDIRLDEGLVLKTSKACERLVGSNPTSSVRPQSFITPFSGRHQYTRPIDAANKVWTTQRGNQPLAGSKDNKNTKPRSNPGLLCIIKKRKERKTKPMSPVALPPKPEYTSAVALSPKLAFEQMLGKAVAARISERHKTDKAMVSLNILAITAREN